MYTGGDRLGDWALQVLHLLPNAYRLIELRITLLNLGAAIKGMPREAVPRREVGPTASVTLEFERHGYAWAHKRSSGRNYEWMQGVPSHLVD